MKTSLVTFALLLLASAAAAQGPTHLTTTREVEGPTQPFARQMTGHPFRAVPITSPNNFALPSAGNFQAQAFPRTQAMYVRSFSVESPGVPTMIHEAPGGLTTNGLAHEMSRPWQDRFMPFNTGRETWQPTSFAPSRFPVDSSLSEVRPIAPAGLRVSNGPSWINIDISKAPIAPRDGFVSPLPKAVGP